MGFFSVFIMFAVLPFCFYFFSLILFFYSIGIDSQFQFQFSLQKLYFNVRSDRLLLLCLFIHCGLLYHIYRFNRHLLIPMHARFNRIEFLLRPMSQCIQYDSCSFARLAPSLFYSLARALTSNVLQAGYVRRTQFNSKN